MPAVMGGSAIDPLDALLGYQLRRASAVMMADLGTALAPLDLRPAEASILLAIDANAPATASAIGKLLGIQRANMVPLVAGLAERGAIERDAIDGRAQALTLSPRGHDLATAVRAAIATHERGFLPELADTERAALIAQLRRIREH